MNRRTLYTLTGLTIVLIGATIYFTPAPISEREANQILRRVEEGVDKPRPKVLFEAGQVVRVTHGPFNDFIGTVAAMEAEKSKVRVMVNFFGRDTPVELDFLEVEKV